MEGIKKKKKEILLSNMTVIIHIHQLMHKIYVKSHMIHIHEPSYIFQ